jgi:hypothetical protein
MPKYNLYSAETLTNQSKSTNQTKSINQSNSTNQSNQTNQPKQTNSTELINNMINNYTGNTNCFDADNIDNEIADYDQILNYNRLCAKSNISKDESIFKHFSPFDKIIESIVKILKPLYKNLGFRSTEVATISLFAYFLTIYFSYHQKNNILWISFMFASLSQYLDRLYYYKLTGYYAIKEQSYIIIKFMFFLFGFILFRCNSFNPILTTKPIVDTNLSDDKSMTDISFFSLSSLKAKPRPETKTNYNLYILLFGLVISILLNHHTSKNLDQFEKKILGSVKNKSQTINSLRLTKRRAKLNNIKSDLKYMRIITYLILGVIIYNLSKTKLLDTKSSKDKLNIFILNE